MNMLLLCVFSASGSRGNSGVGMRGSATRERKTINFDENEDSSYQLSNQTEVGMYRTQSIAHTHQTKYSNSKENPIKEPANNIILIQ